MKWIGEKWFQIEHLSVWHKIVNGDFDRYFYNYFKN